MSEIKFLREIYLTVIAEKIAIVGLGYVGLPLAYAFAKKGYELFGFDIDGSRIEELKNDYDRTFELDKKELISVKKNISYTSTLQDIKEANIYIITVPTPIDKKHQPDLTPLKNASKMVGKVLKKGDLVIYESTVYPGVTEEICVKELEYISKLKYNEDFFCGYSPERVNPSDKKNTITNIVKITSGSTPKVAKRVDELYKSIIEAGTFLVSSIKVAEAAKVIENTQRDVNIALINELAMIFNTMGIDTKEVIEAASTKWNFIKFTPGLVGGHCIGVDPYYLTFKAQELGYKPNLILGARYINESMGKYVANQVIKLMIKRGFNISDAKVLILGITFKENCPDIRNSKVIDIIEELKEFGCQVDVYDPITDAKKVKKEYDMKLLDKTKPDLKRYDAVILAVAHNIFKDIKPNKQIQVVYDVKSFFDKDLVDKRL